MCVSPICCMQGARRHAVPVLTRVPLLQFSKEKYLLESPPEKLRKELEEELKLSAADIRSHGWYHGHIPREVSEVDSHMGRTSEKCRISFVMFYLPGLKQTGLD